MSKDTLAQRSRVNAWIPRDVDWRLEDFARENGLTKQEAVEMAIREMLHADALADESSVRRP